MNNSLFILNDPPYGTERSYNGLRSTMDELADWTIAADCVVTF